MIQYGGLTGRTSLSPPCAKVHMALVYKGVPYRTRNMFSPAKVRRYNPRGRVPVLLHEGETLVDSSDILTELERRFPDPPLFPEDPKVAAEAKLIEDWADEVLYFYMVYMRWVDDEGFRRMKSSAMHRLPLPVRWIAPGIARRAAGKRLRYQGTGLKSGEVVRREFGECLDALAGRLEGGPPFLAGDALTHGDLAVAAVLDQCGLELLMPETAAEIARRPALVTWLERVHALLPNVALPGEDGKPTPPTG
ncbi:hypothetical protein ABI59_10615 [Acidobacteria bacterium Mor1]|nr:hypothetical protein ABI59_10615 [Acidobacteria bacterium Mor1]